MASRKKKKRIIKKRRPQVKKKIPIRKAKRAARHTQIRKRRNTHFSRRVIKKANPERDLSKALTDLTKILPRKTLARKFRLTPRQISLYKIYRKRKPLSPKKQEAIMAFYKKLQGAKNREDILYSYRVTGPGRRITPVRWIPTSEINNIIKKNGKDGIKKTAKQLGVSQETILRWKSGQFSRMKPKNRKRLSNAHKKAIGESYDGIFFILREFRTDDGPHPYSYTFIALYTDILMEPDDFTVYVQKDSKFQIKQSIIKHPNKFTESQATTFIEENMSKIKKDRNVSLWEQSVDALKRFVDKEFKGKAQERLIDLINGVSHKRKKRRIIRKKKNTITKKKANNKRVIKKKKFVKKAKKKNRTKKKIIARNKKRNNKAKKRR